MLKISDLTVTYDAVQALNGVSLQIGEGECVAIVGSNGCGKSTILRTISGLKAPQSGEITFNNRSLLGLPGHRRTELGIAHVPEGRRVFPEMSVQENLIVGAVLKTARSVRKETLTEIYDIFPKLSERRHQLAGTLSGGEQQMLVIGRGLMLRPKLLMLDEPSLGLAPVVVDETYAKLRQVRGRGMSILLVEQNVHRALTFADRGHVLENGRMVFEGPSSELLNNNYVKEAYLGL